jgi:hypothetical protein
VGGSGGWFDRTTRAPDVGRFRSDITFSISSSLPSDISSKYDDDGGAEEPDP